MDKTDIKAHLEKHEAILGRPSWRPTPEHIAELFRRFDVRPDPRCHLEAPGLHAGRTRGSALGILLVESTGSIEAALSAKAGGEGDPFPFVVYMNSSSLEAYYLPGLDEGFSTGHLHPGSANCGSWALPWHAAGVLDGIAVRAIVDGRASVGSEGPPP